VHELWGLFAPDFDSELVLADSDCEAQVNMLLSHEAVSSDCSCDALKFLGQIQGHTVVLLIDYGSSHSFINSCMTGVLFGWGKVPDPIRVRVSNGQIISCHLEIKELSGIYMTISL
jgi:hypothetical protein